MKKRKILMGCGTVLAILALADCSAGYKKFNPATADNEEGSFMGRIVYLQPRSGHHLELLRGFQHQQYSLDIAR